MSNRHFVTALRLLTAVAYSTSFAFAQVPEGLSSSEWTSIRAGYEDGRHRVFECSDGTRRARTQRQQYSTTFDGGRAVITPDTGDWAFGLEFTSYGFDGHEVEVLEPLHTEFEGRRLAYTWDDAVTEWYVNDDDGLEHGFTVSERPGGADSGCELRFDLRVLGDLVPLVDANGLGLSLFDEHGGLAATYAGLVVTDARGRQLEARLETAADVLSILVDESGAAYPLTIDPTVQQAYLKASNTGSADFFGASVAISGDTVVVGALGEDSGAAGVNGDEADESTVNAGAAYVFTRSGSTWVQQAYLKASNPDPSDRFGGAVAIDGDTIVVGAIDEDSSATGVDGDQSNDAASFSGAAYVFVRNGSTWDQQAYLKASNTGASDQFGSSVAIDGDTLVVAAVDEDSGATGVNGDEMNNSALNAGAVYVFTRTGPSWTQQAYLKASNTGASDIFGSSVAIDSDTLVVGAEWEDSNATGVNGDGANDEAPQSGAAYVFTRTGSVWSQQAYLKASNAGAGDGFGFRTALDVDTLVVGAPAEDSAAVGIDGDSASDTAGNAGAAYVFTRSGSSWTQQAYVKASNTNAGDAFGSSVAIDGGTMVVGAEFESSSATGVNGDQSSNDFPTSGAVYVYLRNASAWSQTDYLKASNTGTQDNFGTSVAIDGGTIVVGADREDSSTSGVNGSQTSNSASNAGAVYVFEFPPDWLVVPGCYGNTASYVLPGSPAQIDSPVSIDLMGSLVSEGVVATYFGAKSVDSAGCGVQLSSTAELLLALTPFHTAFAINAMTGGLSTLSFTLPDNPSLVGLAITFQSAVIDTTVFVIEVSNGLEFVIRS